MAFDSAQAREGLSPRTLRLFAVHTRCAARLRKFLAKNNALQKSNKLQKTTKRMKTHELQPAAKAAFHETLGRNNQHLGPAEFELAWQTATADESDPTTLDRRLQKALPEWRKPFEGLSVSLLTGDWKKIYA
jgi:hypothetical protein